MFDQPCLGFPSFVMVVVQDPGIIILQGDGVEQSCNCEGNQSIRNILEGVSKHSINSRLVSCLAAIDSCCVACMDHDYFGEECWIRFLGPWDVGLGSWLMLKGRS